MDISSLSPIDLLSGLSFEDDPAECITDESYTSSRSDWFDADIGPERFPTFDLTSKDSVWDKAHEDTVTNLLLQEIDFLALSALDEAPDSNTVNNDQTHDDLSVHLDSNNNTFNSSIHNGSIQDSFTHDQVTESSNISSASWVTDSLEEFTSGASLGDDLTEDFDLLSYTGSDYGGSFQQHESLQQQHQPNFLKRREQQGESAPGTVSGSCENLTTLMTSDLDGSLPSSPSDFLMPLDADDSSSSEAFTRIKKRPETDDLDLCSEVTDADPKDGSVPGEDVTSTAADSALLKRQPRRDVNEPRRPKNGFIRFSVKHRAELLKRYPYKDNRMISKLLGVRWKKMTAEEKRPYVEEFNHDIHEIRQQNPKWRYAPAKRSAEELIDPMNKRLRPRDKIRPKMTQRKDSEWNWETERPTPRRNDIQKSPLQRSATMWKQCYICSQWRPLPAHIGSENLTQMWCCYMNPDNRFNQCGPQITSPVQPTFAPQPLMTIAPFPTNQVPSTKTAVPTMQTSPLLFLLAPTAPINHQGHMVLLNCTSLV